MVGIFYPPGGHWTFLLLTVVLAGLAGWQTGRAIASTWKPVWMLFVYAALLGAAARFLHFALFQEPLFAPLLWLGGTAVILALALAGWRICRAGQMATQYGWAFEREGPFGWRKKIQ